MGRYPRCKDRSQYKHGGYGKTDVSKSAHLGKSDTRIEFAVNKVRHGICHNKCDADHKNAALHETVISFADTLVEQQKAKALPIKDLFGDDGTCQQHAELESEDRDDGYKAVL